MLGRISSWLTRSEEKEDVYLRQRYNALTQVKKASLDIFTDLEKKIALRDSDPEQKDKTKDIFFTQEDVCVHDLCAALEGCLIMGLKSQNDFTPSWWHVLYSCSLVADDPILVESIETAGLLSESEGGKARAWLKIVLNNRLLESSLLIILSASCEQVVKANYEEWALMRCVEGAQILIQLIMEWREINFCIQVDSRPFTLSERSDTPPPPLFSPEPLSRTYRADSKGMTYEEEDVVVAAEKLSILTASDASAVMLCTDEDEQYEVSNISFSHRHKGIKPWQHLFGVSLPSLSKNPYHCRFALIDPVLAIPNIVHDCIHIIKDNLETPRIFRTTVFHTHVSQMREFVESNGCIPPDIDAHCAGALLLDFFKYLPEPLLTSEKYDAFVASGRLKDEEASVRNIICLVQDLPSSSKFVLERVITMMNLLLMPENSKENGLDLSTASIVLAPAILYKKSVTSPDMATTRSSNHSQHLDLRYAAVGAQVIERMLKHQEEIFKEIRLEVSDALENLEHKKQSLLSVYQMSKIKPQVQFPSDKQQLEEITFAFRCNSQKYYDGFQSQSNPRTKPFQMVSFGVENENSMEKKSDRKHPMYLSANSIRERREAARVTQEIDEANVTLAATGATTTADTANTSDSAESAESADSTDTVDTAATLNVSDQILMEPPSSTSLFAENTVLHETNVSQTKESSSSIGSCIVEFDPTSEEIANLWKKHGFNRFTTSLLENFENGGVLLLRSVYFVIKNDEKCLERLYRRALPIGINYDAGLVSSAIVNSLLNLLKLVPSNEAPSINTINLVSLSVETFWELFEEENYFFKFFQLFFEIFEYNWCIFESLEEASFTRVFCETEEMIAALLANCPNTIADIKAQWEDRLKEEQEVMEIVPSTTTVNKAENDSNSIISGIPRHLTQPKNPHTVDNSSEKNPKKNSFCFKIEEYTNKLMHVSSILSLEQVAQIDRVIPITCQLCKWKLLYSNDLHGSSLDSLLMLSKNQSPTLLVIQDDQGNVFGGFASDEWHTAQQYYGNGETFLFTFSGMDSAFVKYPWSRKNNYFMLCSKESIVMGGGGSFGLYLDADLSHGTTGLCETFSSKPLVPSQEFGVIHIEVWGFSISGVESTALDKRSSIRDF